MSDEVRKELSDDERVALVSRISFDLLSKRSVWFKIGEQYGVYMIQMYYDNGYNMADGQDL